MELRDKAVIVTGASGGIGSAIAHALADRGARIALVARSQRHLNAVVEDITRRQAETAAFPCDIRHTDEVEQMVSAVKDRFGTVDVLVNSAFWGPPGSIEETDEEFWDKTVDTTLKAPFLCARAVTPIFKEKGGGRIVNIGSMAGKVGEDNRTAYCAAKWGLEGLSAALAVELGRYNIHVHLISPAATRTAWWPSVGVELSPAIVERMIPPEAVAEAVCWVLSQPDQVHIPDVAITNYRNPFEGKGSPFERRE